MPDLYDLDHSSFVVHRVDDPVGALADPVPLRLTSQLLAAGRPRYPGEGLNSGRDPDAHTAGLNGFEFLGRGRLDQYAIACHAAVVP